MKTVAVCDHCGGVEVAPDEADLPDGWVGVMPDNPDQFWVDSAPAPRYVRYVHNCLCPQCQKGST